MNTDEAGFKRIAIIGLGLIGGSLCLALRRTFPNVVLVGVDKSEVIEQARGKLDHVFAPDDLEKSLRGVDLVFLSTPISAIIDYLPRVAACIDHTTLVTDAGSTKAVVVDAAQRALAGRGYFIGGHPMAGSERSGWEQANVDLFNKTTYVLTPALPVPSRIHDGLVALLQTLGAHVVEMDAETHDRVVAQISHLPQLLAVALMNYVGRDDADKNLRFMLSAGGLRDMTRIAASSFHIWQDILRTNKSAIKKALQEFRESLSMLEALVDDKEMNVKFKTAKVTKQQINSEK